MTDVCSTSSQSKPPPKKRKLYRSRSPASSKEFLVTSATSIPPQTNKNIYGDLSVCASCHRATPTGTTSQCAICSSTACTICSRTCTHSALSHPPTPLLTWSPSPSPSLSGSPRRSRSVLSLINLSNSVSNLDALSSTSLPASSICVSLPIIKKRRKLVDEDDQSGVFSVAYTGVSRDRHFLSVDDEKLPFQEEFGLGCGRLVCRQCCYEDVPSNTTTCIDCYGSLKSP